MCGLVGLVSKAKNGFMSMENSAFRDLLHIDQLRGEDSTGIIAFHNNGDVEIMKEAIEASTMMMYKEYGADDFNKITKNLFSTGRAVLGHNRKATIGKVSVETAHPFVIYDRTNSKTEDRWFFMHNGTLKNHKKLADGFGESVDVDSEALGHHICHLAEDTSALEKALSEVDGAYACQWVDQEKQKLYLLRNKERPLWVAETAEGWMWASEVSFIYAAAGRNRIKVNECKELPVDTLFSIDLNNPQKFEGVALTVKKSGPLLTPVTKGAGSGVANRKISKNYFKALSKRLVGTSLTWWLDDYVERHYPEDRGEWLTWGNADHIFDFPHRVETVMKTTKYVLEHGYSGTLMSAKVVDLEWNKTEAEIIIRVEDADYAPRSCH